MDSESFKISPIKVEFNQDMLNAALTAVAAGQYKYGLMVGINNTARDVQKALVAAMPVKLDRPRPFTVNSLYTKFARDKNNPEAEVLYRQFAGKGPPAARYLIPQVEGGKRVAKGFEKRLQARGKLPAGRFLVPGKGLTLDKYGNVPGAVYTKILSALKAQHDETQNTASGGQFFIGSPGGKAFGIYKRMPGKNGKYGRIFPFFIAVDHAPNYEPRFPFFDIGQREMERVYSDNIIKGFDHAIATAR